MIISNNTECEMCIQEEKSFGDYENYSYIYVVQLNKTEENLTLSKIRESANEKISFNFGEDGYYTIARIEVKKYKDSLEEDSEGEPEESVADIQYYYDGEKFLDEEGNPVSLQDVIDGTTSQYIEYSGFFSTCRLRKCFITLCKKILNEGVFSGDKCTTKADPQLSYQRDLVWSVYNTIQYLLDFGQYDEAQRLIERINVCPGICHGVEKENGGGCGCHG